MVCCIEKSWDYSINDVNGIIMENTDEVKECPQFMPYAE